MSARTFDRVALALTILSLAVIGIRPSMTRFVDPTVVVVRAPGAGAADARLVADSLHAGAVVEASERGAFGETGTELHVVGWGLDARELRRAAGRSIVLHPRPLPDGIREVSWSGPLLLGDMMTVQATVRERVGRYVVLSDDAGPVDSVRVPTNDPVSLTLRHAPTAVGTARYTLRLAERSDTFSVFIAPAGPPTTLILASAPSREWSDLRDWLAAQGGVVRMRTTMSRDRVATDLVNERNATLRLTAAELARTDLVVTDGRTLGSLPASERAALRTAISGGLGLLLLHDRAAREDRSLPWRSASAGDIDTRDVRPRVDGVRPSETPVYAEAFVLAPDPRATMILDDGQGGILASTIRQGRGRMTATMVNGAGRWLRGGEPAAYAAYWSALFRPTARADARTERWDAGRGPVMVDNEVELVRWGGGEGSALVGTDSVRFSADPLIAGRSVAKWWPLIPGMTALDRTTLWVSDSSAWPAWRAAERRRVTGMAIAAGRSAVNAGARVPRQVRWPLWPFFVLLVASTGWLWRKIGG